jgi:hypothetical protein
MIGAEAGNETFYRANGFVSGFFMMGTREK